MARTYAEETRLTKLRVNLIDPGTVRTAIRAEAFPGEDPASQPHPDSIVPLFLELAAPDCERHGEIIRAIS